MAYERKYFIHNYDCDISGRLSVSSMMKYFEDIAFLQSEEVGYGMNYYLANNVGWILHQWNIDIYDRPFFMDTINLVTNPYSYKAFMANREFEIYSEDNDLLVKADSVWIFLDTRERKPKRIDIEVMKAYGIGEDGPSLFTKLSEPDLLTDFDFEAQYKIRKGDIDINNHLNNIRYIDLSLETLPDDITEYNELTNIEVIFKKEMLFNENMNLRYKKLSESALKSFNHSVLNEKNEVCAILKTDWV